ncbi:MAG: TAXI family TRAP transporter solute-binding subunit, partial [Acholeplasmataceae bacterium]|nr:TAXI family TRAP transporter solute-binding subunit [Acholeplasmataceae bacterium]
KSGITSLDQIKGKRVAVGAAGSGTEANARQILEAYGITYKDISVQYLSFGEASSALKDGNVDVAFVTAGHPTAAIQDIATQNKVVLIPVDAAKADALIAKYPFYTKVNIPAKTYTNQDADVSAVAVRCMLVVSEKMDAQLGYDITKAIFSNLDRLKAAHAVAAVVSKASAKDGMSITLNAGAEKFFKEK